VLPSIGVHPALALISATGLRRGEALALVWDTSIVNLDEGWLKVRKTLGRVNGALVSSEPKTERSRRTVPLSPAVVTLLREHKAAQAGEKLRAGDQWRDSGLVFTNEFGGPVDPRNLLRVIEVAAKAAGVDGTGVHTLRHSAAVAWLESGVHIKAVADLLGHSSIAITGDVYAIRPMKRPAARSTAGAEHSGYDSENVFEAVALPAAPKIVPNPASAGWSSVPSRQVKDHFSGRADRT
jgi:integrase